MSETAPRAKRKRSAIACVACHDRKVRCNAAHQGIPCSNCLEDGVNCEIYRRSPQIPKRRLSIVEPRPPSPAYSYHQTNGKSQASQPSPVATSDRESYSERTPASYGTDHFVPAKPARGTGPSTIGPSRASRQSSSDYSRADVRPFYAGESEGLEFLFDLVSPDRPTKGLHYATPAATYRAKRTCKHAPRPPPQWPPAIVQQELIRCFFHYVWPAMPIVDARDFLTAWWQEDRQVSPLLLWSVFFAAASYIDSAALKANHLPTRKTLKEQFYQHAKDIHDCREEPEKTVLMQSALLLSAWYIDLEDRDGINHWIGVALSLAHTIGIHRKDNYDSVHPPPFPAAERRIWRCIWWSIYYRDVWASLGFGRPMKIDSEDCDAPMLTVEDIASPDLDDVPLDLQGFIPPNVRELAYLMLNFLELSMILERILKSYYRPRSTSPTIQKIEKDERDILSCRNNLVIPQFDDAPVLALQALHVRAYYTAALIAVYRPYLAARLGKPTSVELQNVGSQAEKAASDMTNVLNEIISKNVTDIAPSMFITCTMTAMQIYFWKVCHSTGLARQYAHNQLDLYMLALSHFRKTYWTADLQYNMFIEALKSLDGRSSTISRQSAEAAPRQNEDRGQSAQAVGNGVGDAQYDGSNMPVSLEDFLISFNPFMGVPMQGDELGSSIDWGLSPASPLRIGESPQTLPPINP